MRKSRIQGLEEEEVGIEIIKGSKVGLMVAALTLLKSPSVRSCCP